VWKDFVNKRNLQSGFSRCTPAQKVSVGFCREAAIDSFMATFSPCRDFAREIYQRQSVFMRGFISWGVHPIARGRHFGFIRPVMKSG
jgi:hypothetical protein